MSFTHDAIGDLTLTDSSIATKDWAYTYDAFGRLTCAKQATTCTSGTTRVQFAYDALDRAATRTNNSVTTTEPPWVSWRLRTLDSDEGVDARAVITYWQSVREGGASSVGRRLTSVPVGSAPRISRLAGSPSGASHSLANLQSMLTPPEQPDGISLTCDNVPSMRETCHDRSPSARAAVTST